MVGRGRTAVLALAVSAVIIAIGGIAQAVVGDLGTQRRISITGPDGNTSYGAEAPVLAYNPTRNEYLAVWEADTSTSGELEVFGRLLEPTGAPLGGQFRISSMGPDGSVNYDGDQPTVTYNPTANEYLVAWRGDDNTPPLVDDEYEIFAQRLSATGVEVGTDDQRISAMGPDASANYGALDPSATYDSITNEYLVAWNGDDNTPPLVDDEYEIFVQRLSATGAEQGTDDQRISAMGPDGNIDYDDDTPSATYNPATNEYLVAWSGEDNTPPLVDDENEVYIQRLSATGAEQGTDDQRISSMGTDGDAQFDAQDVSTAYNSTTNEYLVAWNGDDNTPPLVESEFEIFAQRLSAAGAEVGADDQRISAMGPDGNTNFDDDEPTATYNPTANEYLIAWNGEDNTPPLVDNEDEIHAQRLSAGGAELGTDDQRISAMGPDGDVGFGAIDASVAYNPTTNEYLIAWSGDDNTAPLVEDENEIFARSFVAPDPPVPPPTPTPDPTPTPTDTTPPALELKAKGSQEAGKPIKVKVSCDEACTVDLSGSAKPKGEDKGKLKPKTLDLSAGATTTTKLKLGKLKDDLKDVGKGKAKLSATATDAVGNTSDADKAKVKLK